MKSECVLIIGGNNVGTIHDLQLDWPHFLGKFEAGPLFEAYKDIFIGIRTCGKEQRYDERELLWSQLFDIGIEIRSLDNELLFKRKGIPEKKDIAIIFISNTGISFRIYNREPKLYDFPGVAGEGDGKTLKLNVGSVTVGIIPNAKGDSVVWFGDFQPTPEFQTVEGIFSRMNELHDRRCYDERNLELIRLYKMGLAFVDSEGAVILKRTGEADLPGEIGIIAIRNSRICFNILGPRPSELDGPNE